MADRKKSSSAAHKTTRRTRSTKKSEETLSNARRQVWAIVLFAVAILVLCMVILPGENLWGACHRFLLGAFGWCAYVVPVLLMVIAVILAKSAAARPVAKLWQGLALTTLLSSVLHIFFFDAQGGYFGSIAGSYTEGKAFRGGGALGAVLGYPLELLFTDIGAKIILILLVLVLLMLVTGTTLGSLFHMAAKPVKKAKESLEQTMVANEEKRSAADIDVDMGDGYAELPKPEEDKTPADNTKLKELEKAAQALTEAETAPAAEVKPTKTQSATKPQETEAEPVTVNEEDKPEDGDGYHYPPIALLDDIRPSDAQSSEQDEKATAALLVKTLQDFGISTKIVDIARGPSVTRYELEPSAGVKVSRITGLSDDLALRLATTGVRIEAPIPNKAAVGIEVPNKVSSSVCLRELIDSDAFRKAPGRLTVALGKDIGGNLVLADLAKMPHLLIAGTTGSGKSVCTNSMIQSVLYRATPQEVRLLLIDPKQVEFGVYNGIPHLLAPVVTDPRKAAGVLGWAVTEMLQRYKTFAENNVRDLESYNAMAAKSETLKPMPLILIVIDELSDLMMSAANEVEDAIVRLAQMARAAGMHLVIATQRPSVDVITGLIKANIPSRLALTVASGVDSRTILDSTGAEKLLGRGDMLFMPVGRSKPMRVQGCFVSNREVESVVQYLKDAEAQEYDDKVIEEIERQAANVGKSTSKVKEIDDGDEGENDDMLPQAIEFVVEAGEASTSMLQRRLKVGYARAGRLIDTMEQKGIVGPHQGSKPRQVLMTRQQWMEMNLNRPDED